MEETLFRFYTPKITAFDILKGIFLHMDKSKSYSCNPHKYNVFFQDAADRHPGLFEDVIIERDPFLPYSEDIERAFSLAMEFNIIVRPVPDLYPFRIVACEKRLEQDVDEVFGTEHMQAIKELARRFEETLQERS